MVKLAIIVLFPILGRNTSLFSMKCDVHRDSLYIVKLDLFIFKKNYSIHFHKVYWFLAFVSVAMSLCGLRIRIVLTE